MPVPGAGAEEYDQIIDGFISLKPARMFVHARRCRFLRRQATWTSMLRSAVERETIDLPPGRSAEECESFVPRYCGSPRWELSHGHKLSLWLCRRWRRTSKACFVFAFQYRYLSGDQRRVCG